VNNLLRIPVLIRDGGHLVMIGFGAYVGSTGRQPGDHLSRTGGRGRTALIG